MIRTLAAAATRVSARQARSTLGAAVRCTHHAAVVTPIVRAARSGSRSAAWALFAGGAVLASTLALARSNDEKSAACAAAAPASAAASSLPSDSTPVSPLIAPPPILGHSVFAFGSNAFGCLGLGIDDRGGRPVPTLVPALAGRAITQLVAAGNACAALDAQGQLWTWGASGRGVLGHPGSGNADNNAAANTAAGAAAGAVYSAPALVSALLGRRLIHVALSETHGAAVELLPDGSTQVLSWGAKALGFPAPPPSADRPGGSKVATSRGARDIRDNSSNTVTSPSVALMPQVIPALAGQRIVAVACGLKHTLALSATGDVFSFGSDREGALGLGDTLPRVEPHRIEALQGRRIVAMGAGNGSSLFVDSEGRVYSSGSNDKGQAGTGSSQRRYLTPQPISGLAHTHIRQVAVGALHALAVDDQGRAYSWGWNAEGQGGLGDRSLEHRFPLQINLGGSGSALTQSSSAASASSATPPPIVSVVSAGFGHSVLVTASGALWACGRGREGQLGRGDQLESVAAGRERPVHNGFFESKGWHVRAAAAGADFTLALVEEDVTRDDLNGARRSS